MDGLYFDGSPEPNSFYYNLIQEERKKAKENGYQFITLDCDTPDEFYDMLLSLQKYGEDNIKVFATSKEGNYEVFVNTEVDIDDKNGPSIEADAKKKSKKEKEALLKNKK